MTSIDADLKAGIIASRAGDTIQAAACFHRVLEHDPRNEVALLKLSRLMNEPEQALAFVHRALQVNPRHGEALEAQAMLQTRMLVDEAALIESPDAVASTEQRRQLLGDALVAEGVLTTKQLQIALREQARLAGKHQPRRLGEILVDLKFVPPMQLEVAVAKQIAALSSVFAERGTELFGAFLVRHAFITQQQLEAGLTRQAELKRQGQPLLIGKVLVQCGHLRQDQLDLALITWQHWYKRAAVVRDDPYLPQELPELTTRRGKLRQQTRVLSKWVQRFRRSPSVS